VPFNISNYAYMDSFGRETVTWARRFRMRRRLRAFDATMVYSKERGSVVDYLGTHQHLAVDIRCSVDDDGAMCFRSGGQRFYEGPVAFRFPLFLSGVANVREWWDEESTVSHRRERIEPHLWAALRVSRHFQGRRTRVPSGRRSPRRAPRSGGVPALNPTITVSPALRQLCMGITGSSR
jgi:hypothetical protein